MVAVVAILVGGTLAAVLFVLRQGPPSVPVEATGRVVYDTGEPVAGARVAGRTADSLGFADTTTNASGAFTLGVGRAVLPTRVVVRVQHALDDHPEVRTARWSPAPNGTVDVGVLVLPNPVGAEVLLEGGAGMTADGAVQFANLPPEVDRLFARVYDPAANRTVFPGAFAEGPNIALDSAVFVWMAALDARGASVRALSQDAFVRLRIPTAEWGDLEDVRAGTDRIEVPVYSYDEDRDEWVQEAPTGWLEDEGGTVLPEDAQTFVLQGGFEGPLFAAWNTPHFSWMNVDYAYAGPWGLSRLDRDERDVDCLAQALHLAKTVATSEAGERAFAEVSGAEGNLTDAWGDNAGPELRTFAPTDDQTYGEYRGDAQGPEDEIFLSARLWDRCRAAASERERKAATLMMTLTLLHGTAQWMDDVKKFPGEGERTPPEGPRDTRGPEGWRLERVLFGRSLFLDEEGILRAETTDGALVDPGDLDRWVDPSTWSAPPGNGSSGAAAQRERQSEDPSALRLTLSAPQGFFDAVESVPVQVTYENEGPDPILILDRLVLEDHPLRFDILHVDTGETVGYLGPERRLGFASTDFVSLAPGATLTRTVDLRHDASGNLTRYNLRLGGEYRVQAVYSPFFGLPETTSNPVTLSLQEGGTVAGRVTDAVSGAAMEGAVVRTFRHATPIDEARTGSDGTYRLSALPPGSVTVEAHADGYLRTHRANVSVTAGGTTEANLVLSPLLTREQMRIVLTWDAEPRDLDAHLWLPADRPYHLYYGRTGTLAGCPAAVLEGDATAGFGPETVTLAQRYASGSYLYAVHRFSGTGNLSASHALVQVYGAAGLLASFVAPPGEGDWWPVFVLDGETGSLTPINELGGDPAPYPDTAAGCTA